MRLMICGSMCFAKEMLGAKGVLEDRGHSVVVSPDTEACVENPELNMCDEHNFRNDIMRACMDLQEKCDAILVLNYDKYNQRGYLGAHTLMELGLAYYLRQKIFLLYPIPSQEEVRHAHEVMHMKPIILNGDLSRIPLGHDSSRSDLKFIGQEANKIEDELDLNIDDVLNKLTQEFGEFNDCVQKVRGRYCRNKEKDNSHLEEELGDLIFNLVSVCNRMGVDSNKFSSFAWNTLEKFKSRKEDYKHDND